MWKVQDIILKKNGKQNNTDMKQLISIAFLLALFVSGCFQEEMVKNGQALKLPKVTAAFDQNGSRTYIENGNLLRWNENDQISFFYQYTFNSQYQFDGETGDNAGTFSPINQMVGTGTPLDDHNYAVYPYASGIKITENGVITATLPSEQSYAENSFGLGDNTMVAITEDKNDTFLNFKNVGGYLMLRLYGEDVTVKTITLTGNSNEKLAGKATVTSTYGGEPSVSMAAEATETITLDCGEGVELGTSAETATPFWFVVPPTTFENGFTITVEDVNGGEFAKTTSKPIEIERNAVQPMAAFKVEPQVQVNETPYLTFSAEAAQSLTMTKAVATLEYSVNGGEWKELGTNIVEFGGTLGDLRVRGKSAMGTAASTTDYSSIILGEYEMVSCTGDIRTLVDYENYENANTGNAKFCWLFSGCEFLTTPPDLPATTLAECCYTCMFYYCTNLNVAPKLPANTLTEHCYTSMFSGCSSLTKAPDLPATTLAKGCYSQMFFDCTSLIVAPELPATTLSENCYNSMFERCSKLISAPELPATTLADYCYNCMFHSCSSLTNIPELPVMELAKGCYQSMFSGCSNLTKVPILPATTLAERCYCGMFFNCTSLEETPELPATTLAKECYYIMFSGCSNLIKVSQLPATTLAWGCYGQMFYNCSNLTEAPELPAKILTECSYNGMFEGCIKLNKVTMLATDVGADRCLNGWLKNVSSAGTFIKASGMTSLSKGVSGIPNGWTVKNYGE